jgi:hypothetical protein
MRTFPDAHQARDAEARIARLDGIAETIQVRQKLQLLARPYDPAAAAEELNSVRNRLIADLALDLSGGEPEYLDHYYVGATGPRLDTVIDLTKDQLISGRCLGMVGGILLCGQNDDIYSLSLSKLKGYQVTITNQIQPVSHAPVQMGMF